MNWDPDSYPTTIRTEVHDYDELQEQVAEATAGTAPRSILDLGVGAGETATRVLQMHPGSEFVGIDSSPEMLRGAARNLPEERVTLLLQELDAALPAQRFDLVVSALAIHHLKGRLKAELFGNIAHVLGPGGLFVMGDVIIPDDAADVSIENEPGYDFPSTIAEQLGWLTEAGFAAEVVWVAGDLAVMRAELPDR